MTIHFSDFRTKTRIYTERWGTRFWLYPVEDDLFNVLDWEGNYLATVQRTQSGWRYYSSEFGENFGSRKARKTSIDAFYACVTSGPIRRRFDR